jgi:hypothetical protein
MPFLMRERLRSDRKKDQVMELFEVYAVSPRSYRGGVGLEVSVSSCDASGAPDGRQHFTFTTADMALIPSLLDGHMLHLAGKADRPLLRLTLELVPTASEV